MHTRQQVNNLREIQALRRLSPHPHIIKLLEVLYDQPTGRLALVFELMVSLGEHTHVQWQQEQGAVTLWRPIGHGFWPAGLF